MSGNISWNSAGEAMPALFSYVTFRPESFGAIIYNPYLPAELELNRAETFIAGMFTGRYSLDRIKDEIRNRFKLDAAGSEKKLNDLVSKLKNVCCLNLARGRESSYIPYCPETVEFSSEVHYSAPKGIVWDVTYLCNLHCAHCLTNSGKKASKELTTKKAFELIDTFVKSKILNLSLVGGEPFSRRDITDILRYLADSPIRTDISTNGFNTSEKVLRELRDLPVFQIQVSIDGIGENHDKFRGRKGAFKKARETLVRLRGEGISTSISTTATRNNIDEIEKITELAIKLGCEAYKVIPFIPAGRGVTNNDLLGLTKEDSFKLAKIVQKEQQEHSGEIYIYTEATFQFIMQPVNNLATDDGAMSCSVGYDTLSVGADGTAYPCPFLHDFPLGNLLDKSLYEIWHHSSTLNYLRNIRKKDMEGACKSCKYAPEYCHGGCRASAYLNTGKLNETDPLCFKGLMER